MTISVGDKLPAAEFVFKTDEGFKSVSAEEFTKGRSVLMVGMPGAFTGGCTNAHMPSLVRTADALRGKGVDEIAVIVANDVHVAKLWAEQTGAEAAGISVLCDPQGKYFEALGLIFNGPPAGMYNRATRHALKVDDGVVTVIQYETEKGACDLTAGETLLEMI